MNLLSTLLRCLHPQKVVGTVWMSAAILCLSTALPTESHAQSLPLPAKGEIPVAILIAEGAEVLDFTGPLEVFSLAWTSEGHRMFNPYFVAASKEATRVSGNMLVLPDYTFADAPAPKIVVIPALGEPSADTIDWIRNVSKATDVTMSVCNGAFVLAATGLLDGKPATCHHGAYIRFAGTFPNVQVRPGVRYVETGNLATAGGVTSGIDLALHVVERYDGRAQAQTIADIMEYQGQGWLNPESNQAYAQLPQSTDQKPLCPLCGMRADKTVRSDFQGETFYFCSEDEKAFFDKHPEIVKKFLGKNEPEK